LYFVQIRFVYGYTVTESCQCLCAFFSCALPVGNNSKPLLGGLFISQVKGQRRLVLSILILYLSGTKTYNMENTID
jgi:hypothetical protein